MTGQQCYFKLGFGLEGLLAVAELLCALICCGPIEVLNHSDFLASQFEGIGEAPSLNSFGHRIHAASMVCMFVDGGYVSNATDQLQGRIAAEFFHQFGVHYVHTRAGYVMQRLAGKDNGSDDRIGLFVVLPFGIGPITFVSIPFRKWNQDDGMHHFQCDRVAEVGIYPGSFYRHTFLFEVKPAALHIGADPRPLRRVELRLGSDGLTSGRLSRSVEKSQRYQTQSGSDASDDIEASGQAYLTRLIGFLLGISIVVFGCRFYSDRENPRRRPIEASIGIGWCLIAIGTFIAATSIIPVLAQWVFPM